MVLRGGLIELAAACGEDRVDELAASAVGALVLSACAGEGDGVVGNSDGNVSVSTKRPNIRLLSGSSRKVGPENLRNVRRVHCGERNVREPVVLTFRRMTALRAYVWSTLSLVLVKVKASF